MEASAVIAAQSSRSHFTGDKENKTQDFNTTARQTTKRLSRIAGVTLLGIAFTTALPQAARAQGVVTPPPVSANIEVPAPNAAFLVGHAAGTQNYVCQPAKSLGRVAWTLFTPQATLFSEQGIQLTTHFFSPNPFEDGIVRATWENSGDTSTIWARALAASVDPDFVKAGAIPGCCSKSLAPRTDRREATRCPGQPSSNA